MKTKTFEIEVVSTHFVKVVLPETFLSKKLQDDWERGLFDLEGETQEEKLEEIAKYAAVMASLYPGCNHDGLGFMVERPGVDIDYSEDPHKVIAIAIDEEPDVEILEAGDWKEGNYVS